MKIAKPIGTFTLNNKRVLTCVVHEGNPSEFLGAELTFFPDGGVPKRIRVDGLSTASEYENNVFDFKISGDTILEEEITDTCLMTDVAFKTASEVLSLKKGA